MKNGIILSAVMAALCASGETVKTATQPWVRSYVATNRTDVSGKADVTNVYTKAETDAKIVELSPPADLTDATNYTDRALGSFAGTGTVARAGSYGTQTRWTDATGCVWEVTAAPGTGYEDWDCSGVPDGYSFLGIEPLPESTWRLDLYDNDIDGFYAFGAADAAYLVFDVDGAMVEARAKFTMTNLVGRVALTNDIPDVPPETDPNVPSWAKAPSKPTYTASEVGATDGEAVTNIAEAVVREKSLCGIWDSKLGVWWTPHMIGGAYYWTATTNVNLNAEN